MTGLGIQNELRRRIRNRELPPGTRIPSLRELARTFGVSRALAQQAVKVLVAQGCLDAQAGRGTFVPASPVASKTVALVLPSVKPEHMRDIIQGVKVGLGAHSYRLLLQVADADYGQELELLEGLTDTLVAGAIVYPPPYTKYAEQLAELVQGRQLPTVLVDTELPGVEVDAATTHRAQLGHLAMEHLVANGHSRIGILGKNTDSTSEQQLRHGMAEQLKEAGLDYAALPRLHLSVGRSERVRGRPSRTVTIDEFLQKNRDLTAVVATDDGLAAQLLKSARALGLRIPDDLSLIVLGDIKAFELLDPPVTVVQQPHEEIGRVAAERLLQRLAGDTSPAQSTWLRPTLVARGSVRDLSEQ